MADDRDRASIAEELDAVARARRSAALAGARPAWVDAIAALMMGAAATLALTRDVFAILAAVGLLIASVILTHRFTRRRGRLTDERAVNAQFLLAPVAFLAVFIVGQLIEPGTSWWWLVVAGLAIAAAGYAYLRLDERYQTRRLAARDYGPYDLT
ncbi:MAG: hypothetical protein Q4F67_11515 [Propionibacteriaceae bacterium]|nr:hypothetical protein [Propionibacteriaceae bacterium]